LLIYLIKAWTSLHLVILSSYVAWVGIVAADVFFESRHPSPLRSSYFPRRPGPSLAVDRVLGIASAKKLIVDDRLECGNDNEEREKGKPADQGLGDLHPSQCHRCNNCVGSQYACDDAKMLFRHQKIDQITSNNGANRDQHAQSNGLPRSHAAARRPED